MIRALAVALVLLLPPASWAQPAATVHRIGSPRIAVLSNAANPARIGLQVHGVLMQGANDLLTSAVSAYAGRP